MANQLTMADIQAILTLHDQNWSNRKIARELNVDRETVANYIRAASCVSKPATSVEAPIGSDEIDGLPVESGKGRRPDRQCGGQSSPLQDVPPANSKPAKAPIGSEAIFDSKPATQLAKAPIGSEGILGTIDRLSEFPEIVADIGVNIDASAASRIGK